MPDYFALLDEPRRPWLDADALKQKFLKLSAQVHPDRVHQASEAERVAADQRYKELNAAFQCLREPRDRLRHLLELERNAHPVDLQEVPPLLADLCMDVAKLCRDADRLAGDLEKATSPILRAQRFSAGQELTEKLLGLQEKISSERESVIARLKSINGEWNDASARPQLLAELERMYRLLGFFLRWSGQIQERIVRLAM